MIALLYVSETDIHCDHRKLRELHDRSLQTYQDLEITGCLGWENHCLFQYLEGPEQAIEQTLAVVQEDSDQQIVRVLRLGPIRKRRFLRWEILDMCSHDAEQHLGQDFLAKFSACHEGDRQSTSPGNCVEAVNDMTALMNDMAIDPLLDGSEPEMPATEAWCTSPTLRASENPRSPSPDDKDTLLQQLASANDELQRRNEALQSVNEELYSINRQYQTRIQALSELERDLDNVLDITRAGVIFLDAELRVRHYSERASRILDLSPSDTGRAFVDLAHELHYEDLHNDLRRVMSVGRPVSREVCLNRSRPLLIEIHPYRTDSDLAQGVLIQFRNISETAAPAPVVADPDRICQASRHRVSADE